MKFDSLFETAQILNVKRLWLFSMKPEKIIGADESKKGGDP